MDDVHFWLKPFSYNMLAKCLCPVAISFLSFSKSTFARQIYADLLSYSAATYLKRNMMIIAHNDPRLSWHGQVSLEQTADNTRPWRIPFEQRTLFYPDLAASAATQAGIRLAFHSDTRQLSGITLPYEETRNIDLYVDGALFGTAHFTDKSTFTFHDIPAGEKLLELWLPHRRDFALHKLEIDDNATLSSYADNRPKWMTYGSSITHCGEAASPSFTWPGVVARGRDLNLTCLGYGGQCHLDIQIGRMMRDLPADYISICAGINIYGSGTLNARSFASTLIGFVQLLREKHVETPLALISPIYSFDRETTPNATGWTLQNYRDAVAEAAQTLQDYGDKKIIYINGLDLFNEDLGYLMPDQLHPNAKGYVAMGENFLKVAAPKLFGA
jgi:hypothetical protein